MTMTRKPAGEARDRPRPPPQPESHGLAPGVVRKNVGAAPVFDAEAKRLKIAADAPRGMISNPWVKHWTGAGPAPVAPAEAAPQQTQPKTKAAGAGHRAAGENKARKKAPKHPS
jgi:hypothetical protein